MIRQQIADHGKPRPILGLGGLRVFLDFHDFPIGAPSDENVGSVPVPFPILMVFENERLLLPGVRMPTGEQDLEGPEFVL